MSRKWVCGVHNGEITPGWRTAASQLVGVSAGHPDACGSLLSRLKISFSQAVRVQPRGNLLECFLPVIIKKKGIFVIETKRTLKLRLQQTNKLTLCGFPATLVFVLEEALPGSFREGNRGHVYSGRVCS